jgi:hypothetical protein
MATVTFSVFGLDDSDMAYNTVRGVDNKVFAKFLDSKSKLVNGSWKLKYPKLAGWTMVDNKYHFVFKDRGWAHSFANNVREFCDKAA